jgi:hypothetical protein
MPKTWDSIDGAAASRAPSKPKDTTLPACAAAAKESDTRPLGASDTLHKESRRDGPAHESAGTNTKECACDASRPSISTSTSMRRRYQLPKLAANCGNRPFTSETCAVPPSICRSRSSQEQLSASSLQYVAIPWMAPSQSNGVCIWDELEVPRSYRGNGIAGGPSMGGGVTQGGHFGPNPHGVWRGSGSARGCELLCQLTAWCIPCTAATFWGTTRGPVRDSQL